MTTQPATDTGPSGASAPVLLEKTRQLFRAAAARWDRGEGALWAERCDTYMYLACMRTAGWETDYSDLITIAGQGPSFLYSQAKWFIHYVPPKGRDDRIAHATGFGFAWKQYKTPQEYWPALKAAIDAGKPVYAPFMEGVLFVGYQDAAEPADRKVAPMARVFVDKEWWTWQEFCNWHAKHSDGGWLGCHTKRVEPWPARKSAEEVIRHIHAIGNGKDSRAGDKIVAGVEGIKAYADDLADLTKAGAREEKGGYFQGGWRGCHNIYPQMSGRPAGAVYLRRVADLFDEPVKKHLLAAAAKYDQATEAWKEFERHLGRGLKDKHNAAWQSPTSRQAGAAAVMKACHAEKEALAELGVAVKLLDQPTS